MRGELMRIQTKPIRRRSSRTREESLTWKATFAVGSVTIQVRPMDVFRLK